MNALKEEFIGCELKVLNATNTSQTHIHGIVMDETHHTIDVLHDGEIKKLLKNTIVFQLKKNDQWVTINGKDVEMRPEDRIKKVKAHG
jgi:RNase P/RNase MRP subunit p29